MQIRTALTALIALAAAAVLHGCGGGGSSGTDTPAVGTTPVTVGNYAGTYNCANTSGHDGKFVAVLPTASGAFSSCSGSVDAGTDPTTCTGSISATGALLVNTVDASGTTATYTGSATPTAISGTYTVPAVSGSGSFSCTHSD